ncbi:hypothetical protein Tco_0034581, partial [Tanacetum coccineum]
VWIKQKSQENRQKRANTDTGNGRAQKKPGNQAKVKKSTSGQPSVNFGQTVKVKTKGKAKLRVKEARECLVDVKKAQGMGIFRLESLLEKAQGVTITDCHAGNPCVHICDPRVENYSPMIENLYGRDG